VVADDNSLMKNLQLQLKWKTMLPYLCSLLSTSIHTLQKLQKWAQTIQGE